jgi:hypothetical protein
VRGKDLPITSKGLADIMHAVLAKGCLFRFKARGWSMTPFIRDGDVVSVKTIYQSAYGVGSIVAFRNPINGRLVVHRVLAKKGDSVYIAGDGANDQQDGWIPKENLIGVVTRIERKGRRVWIGLGAERLLIAYISRTGLLNTIRSWITIFRNILFQR